MTDKRPFPLPTGYFAIPLGLSALSLAWLHMGDTLSFSRNVSDIIGITSVSVWALFVLLYIYKMIYFSQEVRDEYCCPIRFSFLALIPITRGCSVSLVSSYWRGINLERDNWAIVVCFSAY